MLSNTICSQQVDRRIKIGSQLVVVLDNYIDFAASVFEMDRVQRVDRDEKEVLEQSAVSVDWNPAQRRQEDADAV